MDTTAVPPGFEEIRREEVVRAFGKFLRGRYLALPVLLAIALYIGLHDSSWPRAFALVGGSILLSGVTVFESLRIRKAGVSRYTIRPADLITFLIVFSVAALFTGGTRSPFTIAMLVVPVPLAMFQGRRTAQIFLFCFLAALWALVLIQPRIPAMIPAVFLDAGGRLKLAYDVVFVAMVSIAAVSATSIGIALRAMSDSMLARSLEARNEALKLHAERLTDLTTLSAEIAHELKNPLASIKGLGQLMEVEPSRAPERLKVLQGEVDRMRGILDEFLNFSRPLVPLAQHTVDLGDLCRGVIALHEGVAGVRQVMLVAPAERGLEVRCDPRKTKQILVNLVQNAVDASEASGEVRVEIGSQDGFASIRVMDRGPGLSQTIGERAFEPGVTSKAAGSGLGLTIARALAEQHGGSVRLSNRTGGGCIAEVLLPIGGSAAPAAEASP